MTLTFAKAISPLTPLSAVTREGLDDWLADLPQHHSVWAKSAAFDATAGSVLTLPNKDGTIAAAAIGMGQAAFEASLDYAKNREMFGQKLSDFQATQFKLADMAVSLDAARLLAQRAAWLKDSGQESVIKEASFAKLFGTEAASRIINEAVQIHGGAGLEKGNRVERLYREVRALTIYEGTSEIQRQTIARQLLRD